MRTKLTSDDWAKVLDALEHSAKMAKDDGDIGWERDMDRIRVELERALGASLPRF